MIDGYEILVEWRLHVKHEMPGDKTAPVPLYPPQIPLLLFVFKTEYSLRIFCFKYGDVWKIFRLDAVSCVQSILMSAVFDIYYPYISDHSGCAV
jgi:hypothetical protein